MGPSLKDYEPVSMFIATFNGAYYSHLLGHVYGNFHDIVKVEEMINYEIRLRSTKDPLEGSQV